MKTIIFTIVLTAFCLTTGKLKSQTTAMDFTMIDCNGNGPHNLFTDLNSGKVVIIEYFMTSCSPCILAGQTLESMKSNLNAQFPGKIKAYAFGYTNSYSCATVLNWVNTNGITSVPSDSGAVQVAYYGGMGMPTIIIAGGSNHQLLGSPYIGFSVSDTTQMANDIRNFLNTATSIKEVATDRSHIAVYPNPATSEINVDFVLSSKGKVEIDLYDITGRKLSTIYNEKTEAGKFTRRFQLNDLSEGNYFLKISANGTVTTQKFNIIQ